MNVIPICTIQNKINNKPIYHDILFYVIKMHTENITFVSSKKGHIILFTVIVVIELKWKIVVILETVGHQ